MSKEFTYDDIQKCAEDFAAQYRATHAMPVLPSDQDLEPYLQLLNSKFGRAVELTKKHIAQFEPEGGHGYDHLQYVATMAGFVATYEGARQEVIETAVLAGLFHDIDRHLGYGLEHVIEGEKSTRQIMEGLGIQNNNVLMIVRNHDDLGFRPEGNEDLRVAFGSVFDPDKFRFGLEREDTFWRMKQKRGKTPSEVIHDYAFLPPYEHCWHTKYGKEVGPVFVQFGLAIARHVEQTFA